MKIGWLHDDIGIRGGAELSSETLKRDAPDWVDSIVDCPPNKRPPDDVALFVVQNCITYHPRWIEELTLKPVVKCVRDPWYAGSPVLRRWLLDNVDLLVFNSPVQRKAFDYPFNAPYVDVPPPLNLQPFRDAALPEGEREGNVFVGRADVFKGTHTAIDWALRENEPLDLYGTKWGEYGPLPDTIRFRDEVEYDRMPYILGRARRFVFFPMWPEAFGRAVAEAWAAGCELVTGGRIGALWWIANRPDDLDRGAELFWEAVEGGCMLRGAIMEAIGA